MIHAYQEIYLSKAQSVLGNAFDYAINDCKIPPKEFLRLFLVSSVSKKIENGEPLYLVGKSGAEIVIDIIYETTLKEIDVKPNENFEKSIEYWIGFSISYYQWYTNRKFFDIFEAISYDELYRLYFTLHEADISKFVDVVDARVKDHFKDTNLKHFRLLKGYSQAKLSKLSGVNIRSIQMYEERKKDINKAAAITLASLSKTLNCKIEDLIEN